jgi:hypothetical protein
VYKRRLRLVALDVRADQYKCCPPVTKISLPVT